MAIGSEMAAADHLHAALARCYAAFASVPRPRTLSASPLRDADGLLATLTSRPLRELSAEEIGPYSGWAITTVGSERDYRYFLPRILELAVTSPVWIGSEPPVIADRVGMADWRGWPDEQQQAVLRFFLAAFQTAIEIHPEEGMSAQDWLCGLVHLGEPSAPLMELWCSSHSSNSALQMADFIKSEAKSILRKGAIGGPFWQEVDEKPRIEIAGWLKSERTAELLRERAGQVTEEDRFFYIDAALNELARQY
jgi:hypothetical protein